MNTTVSSPLYVTSQWPGPGKVEQTRSVAQPGGDIMVAGPATINIADLTPANCKSPVRWQAQFSQAGQAAQNLPSLPDTAIKPSDFGGATGPNTSKLQMAAQAFQLPFVPGDSHLTMIAKTWAGRVITQEDFNVHGVMAAMAPPKP
ncbi:MAG TPA: hypothetical protein VGO93_20460 [Candidatus Xenobia bacterium]|jgi:hypothetical protein